MAQQPNYGALSDASVEQAQIERARRYAELMQQQSMQPVDANQMAGGWVVPVSPLAGAAKMAQAYRAKQGIEAADARQKALADRLKEQGNSDVQSFMQALQGTPAREAVTLPEDVTGPVMNAQPAVAGDKQKALSIALQSQNPLVQGAGSSILADMLKNKQPIKVGQNDTLVDPTTLKPVYSPTPQPKYHVVEGALVPEPMPNQAGPVAPVYSAPKDEWSEPYTLGGQTVQKNAKTGQIRQAVTLPPQTNVSVNTDKSYFGNVAEGLAKQDVAAIDAARSAPQRIESARGVRAFLDKNPITGSFAEQRLSFEKALSTAGLIDGERVKNTEGLASNLASQTLDAIKTSGLGSGQGFTDKDRQFLERAKSGNIEINAGTLRQLADLNERAAKTSLQRGNEIIRKLKSNKQMGQVGVGLDEIPEPGVPDTGGFKVLSVRPK